MQVSVMPSVAGLTVDKGAAARTMNLARQIRRRFPNVSGFFLPRKTPLETCWVVATQIFIMFNPTLGR